MDANEVLVSIIIPVYNVEDYLEESLRSAVSQTFDNYEIIIINDGSTDNSELIINDFMQEYHNIKLINQENRGQSAARNRGIELAEGEYIYFLDSDDFITEDSIQIMYSESVKNNLDLLLFSGTSFYEENYKPEDKSNFDYIKNSTDSRIDTGENTFIKLVKNKEYSSSPCLYFFKKELLEEYNINFYEGIIHEDGLFSFQLILAACRAKVINNILFFRRIRPSSTMTGQNYINSVRGNYIVFNEMIKIAELFNNENPEFKRAVEMRLSIVYGSIVNKYIYIDRAHKRKVLNLIKRIKMISKNHNYFNRKDFWLFEQSEFIYSIFRKNYDYFR